MVVGLGDVFILSGCLGLWLSCLTGCVRCIYSFEFGGFRVMWIAVVLV